MAIVPLEGRVALVTGAARGIGYAVAERLGQDGARLVLADVDAEGLEQAAATLTDDCEVEVVWAAGDLSQLDVASAAVARAETDFGGLDILVNNAGGGVLRPFLEHTPETLRQTIDRNLWTAIWCSWLALPLMKANGFGRVVNIGADSVRNGLWDHAAYNAAKGGMHGMTTGLAREFAGDGITVNTVAPCVVNTPQFAEVAAVNPRLAGQVISVVPVGRPGEMQEVASMVAYLVSDEAGFVTGQVISVNGGSTML
ncbi:SDR family NAD(P)-dependent oxidoreductase [Spectribacter hydrogenooxidans]|uniref:SDR family oxidoreductase n=1 Tax=Spectribacter hydrogenoxidans TaxID=3075608 RepID=A0ABU3C4A6_9GAMM|nr:SDR family oxidoreductase [Salinisphaera sp. W335]MDT0636407.1 SDR family oxidoreductase [Salinisphaera sp. W335]